MSDLSEEEIQELKQIKSELRVSLEEFIENKIKSLKEYFEVKINAIELRLDTAIKVYEEKIKTATAALESRLQTMNEFRNTISDIITTLVDKAEFLMFQTKMESRFNKIEEEIEETKN